MPEEIKQEVIRVVRVFGAGAITMTAVTAYAFATGWKQCGSANSGFGAAYMGLILAYPSFFVGAVFGWRPRNRTAWIIFVGLCLLPAIAAAIFVTNAAPCKGIDL